MVDHEPRQLCGGEETTVVNARPYLGSAGQRSCIGTTWLHTGVRSFVAFGVQTRQSDHLTLRDAASSCPANGATAVASAAANREGQDCDASA